MKIIVSVGELIDKISILELKLENIKDELKISNIKKEYEYLFNVMKNELDIDNNSDDYIKLKTINKKLWVIEDKIRLKEFKKEFDEDFIELARDVYKNNDIRADIKKLINVKYNSQFNEEKQYQKY